MNLLVLISWVFAGLLCAQDSTVPVVTVKPGQDNPAKVRMGLTLVPYRKVTTRDTDQKLKSRYVADRALSHTLRARLERTNHFYFGDWHIESVPQKWQKQSRQYKVRLRILKRYGATKVLEENIGAIDLSGVLVPEKGKPRLFALQGTAKKRFYDKHGNPLVDVIAGQPDQTPPRPTVARKHALREVKKKDVVVQ